MIVRARTVVTMGGPPIDNGAVAIAGDRIVDVGTFDQIRRSSAGDILDLGERVVLPGLINAHCHLDYTALRGRIPPKKSFSEWVAAINAEKEKFSLEDYAQSIRDGIAEAGMFGATSIVNLEGFPQLVSRMGSGLRIWWLAELIDVRAPESFAALIRAAVDALHTTDRWGLAPHSPFTASVSLYQKCSQLGVENGILLSTHIAESRDEMAMFRAGSGPLYRFLQSIGRDMTDSGHRTPLAHFLAILTDQGDGAVASDPGHWIVAHLNELDDTDFALLAKMESKFHIAHCPRSHRYFGHAPFAFDRLRALGFNICLGTDSLASNDDLDLFAEMRLFGDQHPEVSPYDLIKMVTINPARAVQHEDRLGRIARKFYADLMAIDISRSGDVFENIVGHQGAVSWTMVGGTELMPLAK